MSQTEESNTEEKPWWDDPSLPWRHKPTRSDLACWAWIAAVGVWALATLPLRAVLIGWNPPIAAMIMGGRSSVVAAGAWTRVYGGPLALYWVLAALSLVKFSWVYWWAGKLWGTNIIALLAGQSKRAKKRAERAVRVTNRFSFLAIFLTFLPIPFPMPIVFAAIGAAGTSLKRFLPPVIAVSALFQAGYLALGWWIGEPAVNLVNLYAKYMWYVTIGILVVMLVGWWVRRRREDRQLEPGTPATENDSPSDELLTDHCDPGMGVKDQPSSDDLLTGRIGPAVEVEDGPSSDESLGDRPGPAVGRENLPSSDEATPA